MERGENVKMIKIKRRRVEDEGMRRSERRKQRQQAEQDMAGKG